MADDREFYGDYFGRVNDPNTDNGGSVHADKKYWQTLSFLFGWIPTSKMWTKLLSDVDGRLLVSTSPTKSNVGSQSKPAPTSVSSNILVENASRKSYVIQNTGTVDVYLNFTGAAATINDFKLTPDMIWSDDVYYGKITGITASGTGELRVIEWI